MVSWNRCYGHSFVEEQAEAQLSRELVEGPPPSKWQSWGVSPGPADSAHYTVKFLLVVTHREHCKALGYSLIHLVHFCYSTQAVYCIRPGYVSENKAQADVALVRLSLLPSRPSCSFPHPLHFHAASPHLCPPFQAYFSCFHLPCLYFKLSFPPSPVKTRFLNAHH